MTPWTVTCQSVLAVLWNGFLHCPWNSPDKNTGVGCHSLLQGMFLMQGLNLVSSIAGRFFTIWATMETQSPFLHMLLIDGESRRKLLIVSYRVSSWIMQEMLYEVGKRKWAGSYWDLPGGARGKEPTCHCSLGVKRGQFNPWVRKIPWRREWQYSPVFLPGESHGQRSLSGYSP